MRINDDYREELNKKILERDSDIRTSVKHYYTIDKTRKLTALNRTKVYEAGVEYLKDTFIKVYPEYFTKVGGVEPSTSIVISCGSSVEQKEDIIIDLNNTYIEK
jgi:hypothetical protein